MINLKKHDAVADAVKAIMQQEAITTDTLAGRVAGGESNLAKSYKVTLKGDGTDKAPEGKKAESTPARSSIKAEETVTEGWDDMLKSVADQKKPQPNGGSGIKKGKSYGNQKPEKDEKEVKEETVTEGLGDTVKTLAKKTFKAFTGGSDQDQLKRLQKNMGVAQTGKVPSKANEEVELDEALKGDQHKIDKNHNGKIDGQDFKILRGKSLAKFKSEKKK